VAAFRFSRRAEADLLSIGDYTLRTWGKAQAARYLGELEVCCQTLSDNPALGRLGAFRHTTIPRPLEGEPRAS
jgi:plasmid stabilization system protein ParE